MAQELTRLQAMDPADAPSESQFLLDFDVSDLAETDIERQELWICAMRVARIAGMRARNRRRRWQRTPRRLRRRHDPPTRAFYTNNITSTLQQEVFGDILPSYSQKRPSDVSYFLQEPSNKRRRRRRWIPES